MTGSFPQRYIRVIPLYTTIGMMYYNRKSQRQAFYLTYTRMYIVTQKSFHITQYYSIYVKHLYACTSWLMTSYVLLASVDWCHKRSTNCCCVKRKRNIFSLIFKRKTK